MTMTLPTLTVPGLLCPSCRETTLTLDGPRLACGGCGVFVRLLQRHGDPETFAIEDSPGEKALPGSWWLGLVHDQEHRWEPVVLAESPAKCWQGLLTHPIASDLYLIVPTDPPAKQEKG